ncbi:MAG: hypothetical protein MZV70_60335 [Desulfobacterales bacterium]|nr:hypothetical protein [Desulfobacterales bacterium]
MLLSLSNSAAVAMLVENEPTGPLSSWAPAAAGHKSTKKQASKPSDEQRTVGFYDIHV